MIFPLMERSHDLKKSRYTGQQITLVLKAELGTPVEEVLRKLGIGDATFYNRKKKYVGLILSELKRFIIEPTHKNIELHLKQAKGQDDEDGIRTPQRLP